jgi:predicted RND superfamily exporter protein
MPKANKPGGDRPESGKTRAKQQEAPKIIIAQAPGSSPTQGSPARGKQASKQRKPAIGGTAVPGAKSTRPKETPSTQNPNAQQQAETYNRDMRRRMQHMGTGPYSEPAAMPARKKAEKRIEERKKRQEEVKKTVVTKGPSTNIKLGRRNTYFVLGTLAFVVLVIVIALIVHHL